MKVFSEKHKRNIGLAYLGRRATQTNRWLGMDAGYGAKHAWISKYQGKPEHCSMCGIKGEDVGKTRKIWNIQWANISGDYHREVSDYRPLCVQCHTKYDLKLHCKKGHPYTEENTYTVGKRRACRACQRDYTKRYQNKKNHREAN